MRSGAPSRWAYLLQVYPHPTQTFIRNELRAHRQAALEVPVLSLNRQPEGELFPEQDPVARATYVSPDLRRRSPRLAGLCVALMREAPASLAAALALLRRHRQPTLALWQAIWIRHWCRRRGVEHLHCHFAGPAARAAWLAQRLGGPTYSVTVHAHEIFRKNADRPLVGAMLREAEFAVAVSRFNAALLRDDFGVPPEQVRVLYNGVDLREFHPPGGPNAAREPGTVLGVGRLVEKKGFLDLVRACSPLARDGRLIRCDLIGEGPQRAALEREIDALGLGSRVHLLGACPPDRVAESLRRCAVFALPCIRAADGNMDALPTVILEALASGCPSVSTHLSGIPEIFGRDAGRLIPPADPSALAYTLGRLLDDPDTAGALGRAGRTRAETLFDLHRNAAVLAAWLTAAADGKPAEGAAASYNPA